MLCILSRARQYQFSSYRNYGLLAQFKPDTAATFDNLGNKQILMLDYMRRYGHLYTKLDPLSLVEKPPDFPGLLDFGLKYDDKVDPQLAKYSSMEDFFEKSLKLYTNTVGVQFDHVEDPAEKQWLYDNYENFMEKPLSRAERENIHYVLVATEAIDHFMHKKFTTFKRYAGEGGESTAVALRAMYAYASELGVTNIVQSMAHRGRFPIMCSLLDFPASEIFKKIMGQSDMPEEYSFGVCDVVHHLSTSNLKRFPGAGCKEQDIRISVVHNPSHLEAANPVSQGKTKAKQDDYGSTQKVLNLQLHGDAAFAGQGIVFESLLLSNLPNYSIGGTVHLIQNNQIGYTTNLSDSRSTRYSSDVMLGFKYPVIHVNGEDVESVHKIAKFVVAYRQQFQRDILIDLITYRRYGHNEVDEPSFTQPNLYAKIRKEPTFPLKYNLKLSEEGLTKKEDYERIRNKVFSALDAQYEQVKSLKQTLSKVTDDSSKGSKAFTQKWKGLNFSQFCTQDAVTGVDKNRLKDLALQSVLIRPNFKVHPRLQKYFIEQRAEQVQANLIDWPTAEAIAVSSLLEEGFNVRLSGQDVERGTFSQRHWVFVDQKTEEKWVPMQSIAEGKAQGRLQVVNSPLSEAAVMAFDFGYGMENPKNLVIWEAQFGDFYNTGQSIVDTFITCSEEKWMRQSSLVMLLPHGFDGAGPEHSSSRMERWLQQGVQNQNFQFVFPSRPETVFHMLRRQMHRQFRKPLIVASAKSLLKAKQARCSFEALDRGTQFQPIFVNAQEKVERIFFCYGKMTYDLQEHLEAKNYKNFAIITLEQLLPFPTAQVQKVLDQLPKSAKCFFVQEEPQNAGGFLYCQQYIPRDLQYIGRKESPSVAVGASVLHNQEWKDLWNQIDRIL